MKTEAHLQGYAKRQCELHDVLWRKIAYPYRRGAPDTFMAKNGRIVFVELKTPAGTGKLSALQRREHGHLRLAGMDMRVIDNKEDIDIVIDYLNG